MKALAASESKPIIFHVAWFAKDKTSKWQQAGGHYVVCVGVLKGNGIILDPWFGLCEVPIAVIPQYNPTEVTQTQAALKAVDLRAANSVGMFSGWLIRVM